KSWTAGQQPDALLRTVSSCDLLVAAIDPATAESGTAGSLAVLVNSCGRALDLNPQLRLAIAYTKSDEYGVINDQDIRLITSTGHADALQRFRSEADESAWEQFARSVAVDRSSVRKEGMAHFIHGSKGSSNETEWTATRAWLLRQTRSLWELALRRHPTPFLN